MTFLLTTHKQAVVLNPEVAIEAEWGSNFINGTKLTLNHHGINSNNPAPCVTYIEPQDKIIDGDIIVFSHIDLDSIGGCLNALDNFLYNDYKEFWRLAGDVDVNGVHMLHASKHYTIELENQLNAFYAWSNNNRASRPNDGNPIDITDYLLDCFDVLRRIFTNTEHLIEAGKEFQKAGELLNKNSLKEFTNNVMFRVADQFVNHLYNTPFDCFADVIVTYNTKLKSITISKVDDNINIDCCEVMQERFGNEAGGRSGIAGSPRGIEYIEADARKLFIQVAKNYVRIIK